MAASAQWRQPGRRERRVFSDGGFGDGVRPPFGQQAAFNPQQVFLRLNLLIDKYGRPDAIIAFFSDASRDAGVAGRRHATDTAGARVPRKRYRIVRPRSRRAADPAAGASGRRRLGLRGSRLARSGRGHCARSATAARDLQRDRSVDQREAVAPVADQAPVFGSIGIFKPKKGIEIFLRSVEQLGSPDRALLVGDFAKSSSRKGGRPDPGDGDRSARADSPLIWKNRRLRARGALGEIAHQQRAIGDPKLLDAPEKISMPFFGLKIPMSRTRAPDPRPAATASR